MSAPTWRRYGDDFHFEWVDHEVSAIVSRVYESHHDLYGELQFMTAGGGHIHQTKANLLASRRADLVKHLSKRAKHIPWDDMIEQVCAITVREWRTEPDADLLSPTPAKPRAFVVTPLVPDREPTLFFGDGDTGKSLFTLGLSLSVSTGHATLPGTAVAPARPVLYCDWETTRETHEERLGYLMRGCGLTDQGPIFYRKLLRPLSECVAYVRSQIDRLDIHFVVIDSFAYACGPEPESADAAMRTFRAVQQLGVTTVIIAHVPHSLRGSEAVSRPYGSVFVRNSARWSWELRRGEGTDKASIPLALFHDKHNLGPKHDPIGFTVRFEQDAVRFMRSEVADAPDLAMRLPVGQRILAALRDAGPMTYDDLRKTLGATSGTIYQECSKLARQGKITKNGDSGKACWLLNPPVTFESGDLNSNGFNSKALREGTSHV